jgi:hypothetical protein
MSEYIHPEALNNPEFEVIRLRSTIDGVSNLSRVTHYTWIPSTHPDRPASEGWEDVIYLRWRPYLGPESSIKNGNGGFLYVLINPTFPGMCKIGFTTHTVGKRLQEINGSGVLVNWESVFSFRCKRPYDLEQSVHVHMAHLRVRENKEFFQIPVSKAIEMILELGRYYEPIY